MRWISFRSLLEKISPRYTLQEIHTFPLKSKANKVFFPWMKVCFFFFFFFIFQTRQRKISIYNYFFKLCKLWNDLTETMQEYAGWEIELNDLVAYWSCTLLKLGKCSHIEVVVYWICSWKFSFKKLSLHYTLNPWIL